MNILRIEVHLRQYSTASKGHVQEPSPDKRVELLCIRNLIIRMARKGHIDCLFI